jgi:hypothetical protein
LSHKFLERGACACSRIDTLSSNHSEEEACKCVMACRYSSYHILARPMFSDGILITQEVCNLTSESPRLEFCDDFGGITGFCVQRRVFFRCTVLGLWRSVISYIYHMNCKCKSYQTKKSRGPRWEYQQRSPDCRSYLRFFGMKRVGIRRRIGGVICYEKPYYQMISA